MSGPRFDDLVSSEIAGPERDRLRRAHEALVAAGPPPDLSPALRYVPGTDEFTEEVRVIPRGYPPRRLAAAVVLAAAIALGAFASGYAVRGDGGGNDGERVVAPRFVKQVELRGTVAPDAIAVVRVRPADTVGNSEMVVTVEGLPRLERDDYYTLFMTDGGELVVPCGTFNVRGRAHRTTVRLLVGYRLANFDGFALARYSSATHVDTVVLRGAIA